MKNLIEYFEGFVDDTKAHPESETFWVRLVDLDDNEEMAEMITAKAINKTEDLQHLTPGMPFTWEFYQIGEECVAEFKWIVEYWTREEIDKAKKEAEELCKLFKWKDEAEDENN